MNLLITWQNRLDAIKNKSEGQKWGKIRDGICNHFTFRECIAQNPAQSKDDNCRNHTNYERDHIHNYHWKCCWFWMSCSKFIANPHTGNYFRILISPNYILQHTWMRNCWTLYVIKFSVKTISPHCKQRQRYLVTTIVKWQSD